MATNKAQKAGSEDLKIDDRIIRIEMVGSLGAVKGANGAIRPEEFLTNTSERNEKVIGRGVGTYKGKTFPNVKTFFSPEWDNIRQRWYWEGSHTTLTRLVKSLNLRYGRKHPKHGEAIRVESLETHLTNFKDPIFQNEELQGKYFVKAGVGSFQLSNPLHEFFYRNLRASRNFFDETLEDNVGKEIPMGVKWLLTGTKAKEVTNRVDVDKRLRATTLLGKLVADDQRLKAIAVLTRIPGFSTTTSANGTLALLEEQLRVYSDRKINALGGMTVIDSFLHYGEMPADQLQFEYNVSRAFKLGIIRPTVGGIKLQGKVIVGPSDQRTATNYFSEIENQEDYHTLINALKTYGNAS